MEDLISRQEAIKAIHEEYDEVLNIDEPGKWIANDVEEILRQLPTNAVQNATMDECVMTKKGKWIDEGWYADGHNHHVFHCSECGKHYIKCPDEIAEFSYCPYCGAKMEMME